MKKIYIGKNFSETPVGRYLSDGPYSGEKFREETFMSQDITDFISVRNVTGGGVQGDVHLGRVVRWYQTIDQLPPITYASNGNKVAKTDGARACMRLPDSIPADLDFNWYLAAAKKTVSEIGAARFL